MRERGWEIGRSGCVRFPGRVAQEFEMQAGAREIGTLAMYYGTQTGMRFWEKEKKGLARVLQSQTLSHNSQHGTIHHICIIYGNGRKMKKGRKGRMKATALLLVLLTNVAFVRSVPLLAPTTTACGCSGGIRALPADNASGTWCGPGLALAAF